MRVEALSHWSKHQCRRKKMDFSRKTCLILVSNLKSKLCENNAIKHFFL